MKHIHTFYFVSLWTVNMLISSTVCAEEAVPVFTQSGAKDATFAELLQTHGEKDKDGNLVLSRTKPILGSKIDVDNAFLEEGLGKVSNPHDINGLKVTTAVGELLAKDAAKKYTR